MSVLTAVLRHALIPPLRNALTSPGVGGGGYVSIMGDTLAPYVTFTRASTATYVDSAGVMQTAGINEPRYDYDPDTLAYRGLLVEGQRTNLLLNSATLSTQSVTTSATAYTLSFWGTGTITLSGTSTAGPLVGTGASDRVTLSFTPTAGTLTLTVSGTVSNAQLEAGSFATSYIPTTSASVTRAADVARVSTLSSIGFNTAEGAVMSETSCFGTAAGTYPSMWRLGTSSDRIDAFYSGTTAIGHDTRVGGVAQAAGTLLHGGATPLVRAVRAYKLSDSAYAFNGSVAVAMSGGTGLIPSVSALHIGATETGVNQLNGHIKTLRYYPRRLSDAELQELTA